MTSTIVTKALRTIAKIRRSDDGQDLMEYGMLMALIAVLAIGAVTTVGDIIHRSFWQTIALASNF